MAWIVYDAMPGTDGRNGQYGPLPCKRWIATPGEKYKLRNRPAGPKASSISSDDAKAVAYARWIASRDGTQLPDDAKPTVHLSGVTVAGRWAKRARAVSFTGGNGSYPVSILLPNWDFVPAPAVEETIGLDVAFADLLPAGLGILAQALADIETAEPARELEAA